MTTTKLLHVSESLASPATILSLTPAASDSSRLSLQVTHRASAAASETTFTTTQTPMSVGSTYSVVVLVGLHTLHVHIDGVAQGAHVSLPQHTPSTRVGRTELVSFCSPPLRTCTTTAKKNCRGSGGA